MWQKVSDVQNVTIDCVFFDWEMAYSSDRQHIEIMIIEACEYDFTI